jgi:hypothetical protein
MEITRTTFLEAEALKARLPEDHPARAFSVGQKVRTLFSGSGDVIADDQNEYEATFPDGAVATIADIEHLRAPQGIAITIKVFDKKSNDYIVNVLDEADTEFKATGRYPIEPLAEQKPTDRVSVVKAAIVDLRRIRTDLRKVGAGMAADYVQRALKSVEGALRHAERLESEEGRS